MSARDPFKQARVEESLNTLKKSSKKYENFSNKIRKSVYRTSKKIKNHNL